MPVKSLIRFTCVCKSWLSLIKSPEFAAKQYAIRTMSLSHQNRHCAPVGEISLISYGTLDISTRFDCKPINHLTDFGRGNSWLFYGPCNGMFCVRMLKGKHSTLVFLWNPSTRQVFKPVQRRFRLSFHMGFGFDANANANDYKIVAFNCVSNRGPYRSWKSLITDVQPSSNGRMCNWLGVDTRLDDKFDGDGNLILENVSGVYFLLSFDMVDEVFIEIPVPVVAVESVLWCSFVQQRSHLQYPAIVSYGLDDSSAKGDICQYLDST
ncbi:hypothetical protein RDABS01_036421 [Bienertia sinuspersici]